jgi:HlyD family secretion protein
VVLCVAAAGLIALGSPGLSKTLKPVLGSLLPGAAVPDVLTFPVKAANLPVTVVERGNLESSQNQDVYCKVEGQTTIISIIPEGSNVKKGDLVCELDSASLNDQLTNQVITTKGAEASYQNAKLTREVAEIAVVEYLEGIYKQDLETAMGEIALAESDLKRSEDRVEWCKKMYGKGYISEGQYISERLSLQRSSFSLEQAQTKKKVLEQYTREKTVKELKSEVEKARSDELAKQATWELEKTKETKLRTQISYCKLYAPSDGLVVFANDPGRFGGQQTPQIEEGAQVRERQKIFSLPDTSKMQVNTKVHESMIDRVTRGLRARIKVETFAEETLPGVVEDVAPLPDPTSFFQSDVKVYTTKVKIEKGLSGLRPGMSAEVTILVNELENVLSVPVQAVLQYAGKDHVATRKPDGTFEWRDVALGVSNDRLVEVKEGVKPGDLVVLMPIQLMSEAEKRDKLGASSKDAAKKEWDPAAKEAAKKIGIAPTPAVPVAAGKDAPGKDAAEKPKGKRGGMGGGFNPAVFQKLQNLSEDERAQMKTASPEEREALMKKAGLTDAEIEQMKQMRQRMQQGGGGGPGGGGPGFGGPGGGGGGIGGPGGGPGGAGGGRGGRGARGGPGGGGGAGGSNP